MILLLVGLLSITAYCWLMLALACVAGECEG